MPVQVSKPDNSNGPVRVTVIRQIVEYVYVWQQEDPGTAALLAVLGQDILSRETHETVTIHVLDPYAGGSSQFLYDGSGGLIQTN